MPQDIISSAKSHPQLAGIKSCPHCGGRLFFDEEEQEWRCLNCARQPGSPVSVNNNAIFTTETPLIPAETPAISKGRRPFTPAHGPERIYKRHSIDDIWWPPGKITFHHKQMLVLIKNLPQLREEQASIAAEIETRLEKAGIDGLILEAIECWGKSEESLAKYFSMPVWSIRKRANNALRYISGRKVRGETYGKRKQES